MQDAQAAFDKQQYGLAMQLVDSLEKRGRVTQDLKRLKVRTLAKVGKPLDALAAYDAIVQTGEKDDRPLLREVALGFITPLLKDMRDQMRGAAFTALKEIESEETASYFEDGLSDGSGMVRALAVKGLGELKNGQRSPRLRHALEDQAAFVRKYAVNALGKTGDRSLVGLIEKSLEDKEPIVRVSAAGALAMLDQPLGWERLGASAKSDNPDERRDALLTLGALKKRSFLPEFDAASTDRQPSVRTAAIISLGDIGDKKAAPVLLKALHDPNPNVRGAAVLSLGKLHHRDALPELKNSLSDQNPGVRADAVSVLLQFGVSYDEVAGVVRGMMNDQSPQIRGRVARSLVKTRGKSVQDALGALQLLLQDPLPIPRLMAARALGHVGNERVGGLLKGALRDKDEAVRATAAGALIRWLDGKAGTDKGDPLEG